MILRKGMPQRVWFKNPMHLLSVDFNSIISNLELNLDDRMQANLQGDLAIACASFRSHRRTSQRQLKPNELETDLRQIQGTAAKLVALLHKNLEAADAMERVMRPELYEQQDEPAPATWPMAPPIFQGMALAIEDAARRARERPPVSLAYINSERGNIPLDEFLKQLLRMWEIYAREAPTFLGDDQGSTSRFVRFALACCTHLGLRVSAAALSKRAARLYASLPEPRFSKRRRPRGPTRKTTGHIVRKK